MLTMMTDSEIVKKLGERLRETRLRKNYSQAKVAEIAGISVKAVQNAEKGDSLLSTYVAILRVLRSLDQLDNFLPEVKISPKQIMEMQGKKRQRASKPREK